MAYTATQLATLEAVRASGQLRVQLGDKVIQYQSGADLDAAIRQARNDVAAATNPPVSASPFRFRQVSFDD